MTIPVFLLTGFLGSGKTTVLRTLLRSSDFNDTAVVINEFGDIGLDHILVESGSDDTIVLESGCVCCSLRSGLVDTLRRLFGRRKRGELAPFRRIVIETTGLADPIPILQAFVTDRGLQRHTRLDGIIATVDAASALATLEEHPEAVAQVAVADRIAVTKSDLVDDETLTLVNSELASLNPRAPRRLAVQGQIAPDFLLTPSDPMRFESGGWLETAPPDHDHRRRIASFHATFDRPLDADVVYEWLEMLLSLTGGDVLRVKGVVNLVGCDRPVVIHGVQHLVHAPVILDRWPDEDRRSRIVLITRGIDPAFVEDTLQTMGVQCTLGTAHAEASH